jgi:hypothetical protein
LDGILIVRASPTALASPRRIHQTAYVSRTPERYEPGLASAASAAAGSVRAVMVAERGGLTEAGEHFGSVAQRIGIGEFCRLR